MKIRVVGCKDSLYWYRGFINEIFEVQKEDSVRYWCRERNAWQALNFINKEDAEVVEEGD